MNRGQGTFICSECNCVFEATMFDWNHRVTIAPAECPKCGSWHTLPYTWSDFPNAKEAMLEKIDSYRPIWKQVDERRKMTMDDDDISSILKSITNN